MRAKILLRRRVGIIVAIRPRLVKGWYRYWRLGIITAIFNIMIPFLLISWGETRIASGTASILNATTPLFIVLFASWWIGPGHETLTVGRVFWNHQDKSQFYIIF